MAKSIFLPLIDNGMGLSRTSWAFSMIHASLSVLRNYKVDLQSVSFPYPDGAMNLASQLFLESDAEEMIVIDTDIKFEPNHLEWLLSHDEPLVFGLYPKKKIGLEFPVVSLDGSDNPFAGDGPELREVARCARGFMRAHRDVFERLKPFVECIECPQTNKPQWQFWKCLTGGHSEDFAFCDLYRLHGGRIMVDHRICAQHEGSVVYPIPGTF